MKFVKILICSLLICSCFVFTATASPTDENILIEKERQSFQQLFDNKQYNKAYSQRMLFLQRNKITDRQKYLWLKNDAALAVLKTDFPQIGNILLKEIISDPAFSQASPALKNAVHFNQVLYEQRSKPLQPSSVLEPGLGNKEFAWMLDPKFQKDPSAFKEQLQKAVQQLCPNINYETLTSPMLNKQSLSDGINGDIATSLSTDSLFVSLTSNRYVLIRQANDLPLYSAFLWIDTQQGTGVVGFYSFINNDIDRMVYNTTSKNYNSLTTPKEAKRAIMTLREEVSPDIPALPFKLNFFEVDKNKKLSLPRHWLMDG